MTWVPDDETERALEEWDRVVSEQDAERDRLDLIIDKTSVAPLEVYLALHRHEEALRELQSRIAHLAGPYVPSGDFAGATVGASGRWA